MDVTTNSYVVNGLEEETEYDFHIKAICGTDWTSEHWVNVSATTLHNEVTCNAPTSVTVNAAATTATVSWTAGEGNNSFEVEYGVRGFSHGSGTIVESQNTTVDINGLEPNTQYDVYVADKGENSIGVMVSAGEPVKNLTVLGLTFESIDDNGHVTYDIKNMYSVDKLQPDRPLLVRLTMMGTIPNYGISYQDKQGRIKRFTITQSGMDGSLQLNPM